MAARSSARFACQAPHLALILRVGHGRKTPPRKAEVVRWYQRIDVWEVVLHACMQQPPAQPHHIVYLS